ncbi:MULTISPECIES: McrC family protein [Pseudomonas]|uniref:McrC family protein n=1 Tax=Pseudomonas TaxID=286 RepID=UPI00191F7A8B|nr:MULTISPECIES: McrC family protein [Pseudomonas]MBL0796335.1 McrC family protein [Pseudomonas sp. B7]MBX8621440.1 McrC family protein [Pseudomonas glycinae]
MTAIQIFEFDTLVASDEDSNGTTVPLKVFAWLEEQCLTPDERAPVWLKLTSRQGRRAIRFSNYVGVLRAPCGYQIEILPKIGRDMCADRSRRLLIDMLKCLRGFRHIKTSNADLKMKHMPLLEVFLRQFLEAVRHVVNRGLRSDYSARQANLSSLRGKLLMAPHLAQNLLRRDRFFTEFDEFIQDRAENRLIHSALRKTLNMCKTPDNQRLARELSFVFAEVPLCSDISQDLKRIRLDRGMAYYEPALDWARFILQGDSPVAGAGKHDAPSLLFPMEALFEAYVAKHLKAQVQQGFTLRTQTSKHHLVSHRQQDWFRLKPDLLIEQGAEPHMVLDTKWKLLDSIKGNSREKYLLSQADFYQLHAYAHVYLKDAGNVVLIYPWTDSFAEPLPVFHFSSSNDLKLWVLPFCIENRRLLLPEQSVLDKYLSR